MSITLDTKAYLDMACQLLQEGRTNVPVTVAGTSMTPFLDPGDTVYLNLPRAPLAVGDVVLFTRPDGRYVLHRVMAVRPDGRLEILGDAQSIPEYLPGPQAVHAVVTGALHGKRQLTPESLRWRFFASAWRKTKHARYHVNRARNYLKSRTSWTL